jgi:hypothetical protein
VQPTVGRVVERSRNLERRDEEGVRVGLSSACERGKSRSRRDEAARVSSLFSSFATRASSPGPGHRKRSEVGDLKTLSDVDTSEGRRGLDQDVRVLTCDPRVVEEVVKPPSEAAEGFLEEAGREHLQRRAKLGASASET